MTPLNFTLIEDEAIFNKMKPLLKKLNLKDLRDHFTTDGIINTGVTAKEVLKYIKDSEPSIFDLIKHYVQLICEQIRDQPQI